MEMIKTGVFATGKVLILVFSLAFAIYFSKFTCCITFNESTVQECWEQ